MRRVALAVPTLLVASTIVFFVFQMLADPVRIELGPLADADAVAARRSELGLDRAWPARLLSHVADAILLRFGDSSALQRPVARVIAEGLGPTLAYALPGFVAATALAIGLGAWSARRAGAPIDRMWTALATVAMSTPSLVVVLLGQHVLAHRMELYPVVGWPLGNDPDVPRLPYLLLPMVLWIGIQLGPDLRHYRALFVQEFARPHVEGWRLRGSTERQVMVRVLRNAAGPVLARIGQRAPHLLVGSVVIEELFNIPGVGELVVLGLRGSDLALVQGLTVALTLATVVAQTALDLCAGALDPRLRTW